MDITLVKFVIGLAITKILFMKSLYVYKHIEAVHDHKFFYHENLDMSEFLNGFMNILNHENLELIMVKYL